jgi:uncharacterized protein (DUF488 family)
MPEAGLLLTIGYAGHDPDSFVATLQDHGVQTILDIRQNPVSRKRGFSKSQLERFLREREIGYIHLRELGVPTELRDRLRSGTCQIEEYFVEFARYLKTQDDALAMLRTKAASERCCLLCVESRPEDCHRSIVAQTLARGGGVIEIQHIEAPSVTQ